MTEWPRVSEISKVADDPTGLINWAKCNTKEYCDNLFKERGEFGTTVHDYIQQFMRGGEPNVPGIYRSHVFAVLYWQKTVGYVSEASEVEIRSEKYKFTGHCDDYGYTVKQRHAVLVDWKITSGIRLSHIVQGFGYLLGLLEGREVFDEYRVIRPYSIKVIPKENKIIPLKRSTKYVFKGCSVAVEERTFVVEKEFAKYKKIFLACKAIHNFRKGF